MLIIKNNNSRIIFQIAVMAMFILTLCGCSCGSKYNYYLYKKNTEEAIKNSDYKRAKDLISYAYIEEKNASEVKFERLAWLFYRLGVIAELSKNEKLAKGYYWGDQIEEGFYKDDERIDWLANIGWKNLDEGNPARSFAEISELERMDPPAKTPKKAEKKKVTNKKRRPTRPYVSTLGPKEEVTRRDTPITYPPQRGSRGLFKVAR